MDANTDLHHLNLSFPTIPGWQRWEARRTIEGRDWLGGYVLFLAEDDEGPNGASILSDKVKYVGEVHGAKKSLSKRWNQFGRAARARLS